MKTKYLVLLVTLLIAGCSSAIPMQMNPEMLKTVQPNEGIVIGSVMMRGGEDILGRNEWKLAVKSNDGLGEFFMIATRDQEEFFTAKMPAGEYHIKNFYQSGFSNAYSDVSIHFKVEPGKTTYIGRLVIEFPPGLTTMATKFKISLENAKDPAIDNAQKNTDLAMKDVSTRLMIVESPMGCVKSDRKDDNGIAFLNTFGCM